MLSPARRDASASLGARPAPVGPPGVRGSELADNLKARDLARALPVPTESLRGPASELQAMLRLHGPRAVTRLPAAGTRDWSDTRLRVAGRAAGPGPPPRQCHADGVTSPPVRAAAPPVAKSATCQ